MDDMTDKRQFRNRICILRSIDRHEVPTLTDRQWERFRKDPYLGYLRLDEPGEAAVWDALRLRENRHTLPAYSDSRQVV